MSDITPILHLPYIAAAQAQKHITHNEALRALDVLVQLTVHSRELNFAPETPAEGDSYIIGGSATGLWAGHDGKIAAYRDAAWMFFPPTTGWRAWIVNAGGFKLRLKAGSVRYTADYNTSKLSSGPGGFWFSIYCFQTSSVTFPLEAPQ